MEKDPWKELAERVVLASALAAIALYLSTRTFGDSRGAQIVQLVNWLMAVAVAAFALCFGAIAAWNFAETLTNSRFRSIVGAVMALAIGCSITFGMIDAYRALCDEHSALFCSSR